jgi:hypothetical protein
MWDRKVQTSLAERLKELVSQTRRWEHNIKVDVKEVGFEGTDWLIWHRKIPETGSCEYGFGLSSSIPVRISSPAQQMSTSQGGLCPIKSLKLIIFIIPWIHVWSSMLRGATLLCVRLRLLQFAVGMLWNSPFHSKVWLWRYACAVEFLSQRERWQSARQISIHRLAANKTEQGLDQTACPTHGSVFWVSPRLFVPSAYDKIV